MKNRDRMWMSAGDSADWLGVSDDTVARRGVPYSDDPVPYRIRYKLLALDESTEPERRYFVPDLDALLRNPPPRGGAARFIPKPKP